VTSVLVVVSRKTKQLVRFCSVTRGF